MGLVTVRAKISAKRKARVDFLVDTGATYTVIPPGLAKSIGAAPSTEKFRVTLADGRSMRLGACLVGIELAGRRGPTTALVLEGAEPLLGAETLEALGLRVDPGKRRVEPSRSRAAVLVGVRLSK
jgi:aspartyl protease family protein